jgi:lipooligosaccharide transport system permease protein
MAVANASPPAQRVSVLEMFRRQVPYWRTVYRRTWKGAVITSFVQPWLYLASMGVLLGGYIDAANATTGGASSYLDFVAPGLLAATAMQLAADESMWPVMGRIKWDRTYLGMIASPLRPVDIVIGHLVYSATRVGLACGVFAAVLALFGVFASPLGAVVAWLVSLLVGLAFGSAVYAYSAGAKTEQGFAVIFRLVVIPMFLFSGAFFPVDNLPVGLQVLAWISPLYHGVELARMAALGAWTSPAWLHLGYLAALSAVGVWWSVRRLTRRLVA